MSDSDPKQVTETDELEIPKRTNWLLRVGLAWCWFHLLLGTFLKLTVRDRIPYLAAVFYASPAIVLAVLCGVLAVRAGIRSQKRIASGMVLLGIIYAVWWHQSTYYSNSTTSSQSGPTHSVFFWNVRHVKAGWPRLLAEIKQHDPDLIGLVEAGPGDDEFLQQIREAFPEHDLHYAGMGILLVRGRWGAIETGSLNDRGVYARGLAQFVNGDQLDVILVDIFAKPWLPRGLAYDGLDQLIVRNQNRPQLVFGDFNTPPDSVFAESLRKRGLVNAFETTGQGYHVTWPVGSPVLALDQIWLPPESIHECMLYDTSLSDHRIVTFKFAIATLNRK